jgi:hypothetical protein
MRLCKISGLGFSSDPGMRTQLPSTNGQTILSGILVAKPHPSHQ